MRKTITTFLVLFLFFKATNAQELETILLAKEDAQKLTKAYLKPALTGFIYSMNNGWYHTAKVHKKFGFDITIGAVASFIPEKEEIFDIRNIGLSSASTPDRNTSPTIAGDKNETPATISYQAVVNGQNVTANFQMPIGEKENLPLGSIPVPSLQVSVGLPFKLDAIVRYLPIVGSDDFEGNVFGIGFKKEITDWFGVIDKTPLHVSLLAAYSTMNLDYLIENGNGEVTTRDASAEFKLNTYTFQAIASLNFPIINVYGGLGYNSGNTTLSMLGDYTLTYQTGNPTVPTIQETTTDPFSIKESAGSFNATVGARLSLGFFKIFGSYSLQEYNSVNAGIAFSFR